MVLGFPWLFDLCMVCWTLVSLDFVGFGLRSLAVGLLVGFTRAGWFVSFVGWRNMVCGLL